MDRLVAVMLAVSVLLLAAVIFWTGGVRAREVAHRAEEYELTGVGADQLPAAWIGALVAVEDPGFFEHSGVDLRSPGAGWTTITQGLVKLHYPGRMQGLLGKPRQSSLALALDRALPKESQLTLFLNTAYLGRKDGQMIRGFPQAARAFFGRELEALTREEFLSLVATLVAPGKLDPVRNPSANRERVRRIEALLAGRCFPLGWRDVYLEGCSRA